MIDPQRLAEESSRNSVFFSSFGNPLASNNPLMGPSLIQGVRTREI